MLKFRPYLTFNGGCSEAIELYKAAFGAEVLQALRFGDMPANPNFTIPDEFKDHIVQVTLKLGDDFIRMGDCGPGMQLNEAETERLSIAIEADKETIERAFGVLSFGGRVGQPLTATFYSPCAGVVFDKFGVMWNMVGQ